MTIIKTVSSYWGINVSFVIFISGFSKHKPKLNAIYLKHTHCPEGYRKYHELDQCHMYISFFYVAFSGSGIFLVATGFTSCEHRSLAIAFLSLAVGINGFCRAGYVVNHVDFGPK